MNKVGPKAREFRKSQDLSQKEVAARCNILGWDISRSVYAKIESRNRGVSDTEVELLAKALKVEITDLYKAVSKNK